MRSWMLGALLVCTTTASAFIGNCDGTFSGGVQALYWRSSSCPILYARTFTSDGPTSRRDDHLVSGDYDWGFRVGLGYEQCCTRYGLSYLYIQTTDGARTNAPSEGDLQIQGTGASVDFARTSLKFRHQNIDFRAQRLLHESCGCQFGVVGVARWVDIDMKYGTAGTLTNPQNPSDPVIPRSIVQSSTFDGGGIGVGFAGDFCLPCDFKLGGYFDFAAIIGKRKTGKLVLLNSGENGDLVILKGGGNTGFVPSAQFDLHLSYSRCLCRATWDLVLGYEIHYFWDVLRYSTVHEINDSVPLTDCQSIGFGGPYIGLSASF